MSGGFSVHDARGAQRRAEAAAALLADIDRRICDFEVLPTQSLVEISATRGGRTIKFSLEGAYLREVVLAEIATLVRAVRDSLDPISTHLARIEAATKDIP